MRILGRIKNKFKKLLKPAKKKNLSAKVKTARKPAVSSKEEKEIFSREEMAIEKTKFSHPEAAKFTRVMPAELPRQYGKNMIALHVRDPWWLYCYWEVVNSTFEALKERLKEAFWSAKRVLRVYDVSHINFNGGNAHRYFDIEVGNEASSWYIDTGGPGRSWCVDYGLKLLSGEFVMILRSNVVHTPIEGPSWITDEEWMVPEEMFGRLYGLGFGMGHSSPVGKAWQERMRKALFSGILASPGITSAASPVRKPIKERKFWMVVDCELIVYGATEPDAKVTVQGRPIKLRPDGTFTMRYALPDGKQVIPVKAVSADEVEERSVTPIVTRETKTENKILK
ncbi:MAG: DUF4912 domain-containing protein [Candidatus Omnitrophica bacterium]|nr:DUF4912 domain-containing protein [Candidatus Omnitrophota bacterium]